MWPVQYIREAAGATDSNKLRKRTQGTTRRVSRTGHGQVATLHPNHPSGPNSQKPFNLKKYYLNKSI